MEHFQYKNHVIFPIFNERQNFCTMEDLLFTVFVCIYIYMHLHGYKYTFKVNEAYTTDRCSASDGMYKASKLCFIYTYMILIEVRKRLRHCKKCERCLAPKCNNYTYCINPNSKQLCINRKCLNME